MDQNSRQRVLCVAAAPARPALHGHLHAAKRLWHHHQPLPHPVFGHLADHCLPLYHLGQNQYPIHPHFFGPHAPAGVLWALGHVFRQ